MRSSYLTAFAICVLLLSACGPKLVVTKLPGATKRVVPVNKSQVAVYKDESKISCDYERVALISAKARGGHSEAALIDAARKKAGGLGANAIIMRHVQGSKVVRRSGAAVGTGGAVSSSGTVRKPGRGQFLAVRVSRPCKTSSSQKEGSRRAGRGQSIPGLSLTVSSIGPTVEKALSLPGGAKKIKSSEIESLQKGDVIISIDGAELKQEDSLKQVIKRHSPGEKVQLEILREGENKTVSVTLGGSIGG